MSDAGMRPADSPGYRERVVGWMWASDLRLVGVTLALIYGGFIMAAYLLGLSPNGTVSTLRRVTFLIAVYAIMALALNLHWGYTGLFNIGIAGFMAVGVYTMAMLTGPVNPRPEEVAGLGLPLWAGIVGGVIAAAVIGVIAAFPALRLEADYLAIVTIAFSEIIRLTYLSTTFQSFVFGGWTLGPLTVPEIPLGTGGGQGISLPTNPVRSLYETGFGQSVLDAAVAWGISGPVVISWTYALVLLVFVVLIYVLLARIGNSPFGRVLKAIREDQLVANSLGKNVNWFKVKVFAVGCGLMGLGGILWQGSKGFVNPQDFMPIVTFYVFTALIIGGAGSNTGSVIGGAMFAALLFQGPQFVARIINLYVAAGPTPNNVVEALTPLAGLDPLPFVAYAVANISTLRFVLIGAVLVYLMQNRPDGLLGHRVEVASTVDLSERPSTTDAGTGADAGTSEGESE